jgi:hypothetical protein
MRRGESCFLENMLARMIGHVVISEVGALTYVVLSEVEKHVRYGNQLVAVNVWRCIRDVVQTEVVITEFSCN